MNYLTTLTKVKRALEITTTESDTLIMELIGSASRAIEERCDRHFHTEAATRRFVPIGPRLALIDDLLSASAVSLVDPDDAEFETVTYAAGDYYFAPFNSYPKDSIKLTAAADTVFRPKRQTVQIAGVFGYGDKVSGASPWRTLAGVTGTVASTSGTSLTLSAAGIVEAGMTLRIDSEDMFVEAVVTTTATVRRGVNGSTTATHAAAPIAVALYPEKLAHGCREMVALAMNKLKMAGQAAETVGSYSVTMMNEGELWQMLNRICSGFTRGT